jgi:hypothetical protein
MNFVRLIPVFLSALLIAAHFARAMLLPGMILSLALPAVLAFRRPWAARLVQAGLAVATAEWVRTLLVLVAERQAAGRPWIRLAVILVLVAVVTASSALVFLLRPLRERYGLGATSPPDDD